MPKRGNITAPSGALAAMVALATATPVVDSLPGIVTDALQTTEILQTAIFNFGVSKAVIVPTGTNIATVTGATGVHLLATLTPSEPTKATSVFVPTLAAYNADVEALLAQIVEESTGDISGATRPAPKLSAATLIGRIEDVQIADTAEDGDGIMEDNRLMAILDQDAQTVKVYIIAAANVAATHTAAIALAESVQYVLTEEEATTAAPRVFGE